MEPILTASSPHLRGAAADPMTRRRTELLLVSKPPVGQCYGVMQRDCVIKFASGWPPCVVAM
jgi:hypothetical protein